MKKISVIIPAYNVEVYIREAIESVIRQTYTNLEIILIDDESPDNCPAICDEYAKKDSRIQVVHQKNMGLSGARNTGLSQATGDYILFLDSDDYLALDCCEKMMAAMAELDCDIVVGDVVTINEKGNVIKNSAELYIPEKKVFQNREAMGQIIRQTELRGYAWGKLYKRSIVEGIEFPVGRVYEDRYTVPKYFGRAEKVGLCPGAVTYYRMRGASITHEANPNKLYDLLDGEAWLLKYCKHNYPELADEMEAIYFGRYVHIWIRIYDNHDKVETKKLTNRMKQVYRKHVHGPRIKTMHKVSYLMIFYVPVLYRKLLYAAKFR